MDDNVADYKQVDWEGQLKHKHSLAGAAEKKIDSIRRRGKKWYARRGFWLGFIIGIGIGVIVFNLAFPKPTPTAVLTVHVDSDTAHSLTVEIANTRKLRAVGLSGRDHLPSDRGMLFAWPGQDDAPRFFWMAGTTIPLSIAFIDAGGTITQIEDMDPATPEQRYISLYPTRYALETTQGWFARRGIQPGATITLEAVKQ